MDGHGPLALPNGNGPLRVLPRDAPREPYVSRREMGEPKGKGVHWGQRKLLYTEVEFLTLYAGDNQRRTVVYREKQIWAFRGLT